MNLGQHKTRIIEILAAVGFLILWEIIARILGSPYFPPISVVAVVFCELIVYGDKMLGHSLLLHAAVSLYRVFIGFLIASCVAFFLGLFAGINETFYSILKPIIEAIRPIPPIAWIPFAIIAFSLGIGSYAFIIFLGAFFPIFLNTIAGLRRTNLTLVDVAKTFGASREQALRKVVIPSALPEIVTGMRIGFGIGWMCIIAAEMIGVMRALGLGFFIIAMYELAQYPEMIAGMIMIGIMGYSTNEIFVQAEKHLFKWREEVKV